MANMTNLNLFNWYNGLSMVMLKSNMTNPDQYKTRTNQRIKECCAATTFCPCAVFLT